MTTGLLPARQARGSRSGRPTARPVAAATLVLLAARMNGAPPTGTAVIAVPGTSGTPLAGGASTTPFTVGLPARAACPGDSATDGNHVYSFLVRPGTDLTGVTFVEGPSSGYGIVDATGTYYGAVNTARGTGEIVGIPNDFEWAPLVTADRGAVPLAQLLYEGSTGTWVTGIACADTHGRLDAAWTTTVTFAASTSDPNGFTWRAPGSGAPEVAASQRGAGPASGSPAPAGSGSAHAAHPSGDQRAATAPAASGRGTHEPAGARRARSGSVAGTGRGTAAAAAGRPAGGAAWWWAVVALAAVAAAGAAVVRRRRGGRPTAGDLDQRGAR